VLEDDTDDDLAFMFDEHPEPLKQAPDEEGKKPFTRQGMFAVASIIICHNYFACMVHRKSLFQLVAEAKSGNDESLLKAIQSDKRCLADINYFKDRVRSATEAGNLSFCSGLQDIAKSQPSNPLLFKSRYI
jgi:hypothetical protein